MITIVLSALVALANPVVADAAPQSAAPQPAASAAVEDPKITERVKTEFAAWQHGELVRAHYSHEANQSFSDAAVQGMSEHLKALGAVKTATYTSTTVQGPNTVYAYKLSCEHGDVLMRMFVDKLGKISGISFRPAESADKATTS